MLHDFIALLLEAWHLTGKRAYLDRVDFYGRTAVFFFLEDGNPLPKASNQPTITITMMQKTGGGI